MTHHQAAVLLGVAPDADEASILRRCRELSAEYRTLLAQADSPGLRQRYEERLRELGEVSHLLLTRASAGPAGIVLPPGAAPRPGPPSPPAAAPAPDPPMAASPAPAPQCREGEPVDFSADPVWWILVLPPFLPLGIAGAFLADWLLRRAVEYNALEVPRASYAWVALLLAGIAWGVNRALETGSEARRELDYLKGFGYVLHVPVIVGVTWGLAHALVYGVQHYLWEGIPYSLAVHVAFAAVTVHMLRD